MVLDVKRFNDWLALHIIAIVGSMWCAYFFVLLAILGLPSSTNYIQWISQTFIQLVMLSVIMVGQRILDTANEQRAVAQYEMVQELHDKLLGMTANLDDLHTKVDTLPK